MAVCGCPDNYKYGVRKQETLKRMIPLLCNADRQGSCYDGRNRKEAVIDGEQRGKRLAQR